MNMDRIQDIMPFVIESDGRRERAYDIYSLLLKERIVFLGTPIDAMIANVIIAQLLYLAREDDEKDIMMYINCPGRKRHRRPRDLRHDEPHPAGGIDGLHRPGREHGHGAAHLAARKASASLSRTRPSTCTRCSGGAQGQARDIEIQARETIRLQKVLRGIIQTTTGQPMEKIEHDTDRDFWLDPVRRPGLTVSSTRSSTARAGGSRGERGQSNGKA